ncbi:hypothetical protein EOD39_2333 [Acipenser ruthenus]|uniref:Uncharacterized protein n=1 Tax=Acipenser ruthenus TaxID=7906 RepID=A0A444U2A0_ACIRT|nr:hypothetical protein EOD39_2333 [Acipenser ruthenus]
MAQRRLMTTQEAIDMLTALSENDSDAGNVSDHDSDESWICGTGSEAGATEVPQPQRGLPRHRSSTPVESSAVPATFPVSSPAAAAGVPAMPTASPTAVTRTVTPAASPARTSIQETGKDGTI